MIIFSFVVTLSGKKDPQEKRKRRKQKDDGDPNEDGDEDDDNETLSMETVPEPTTLSDGIFTVGNFKL